MKKIEISRRTELLDLENLNTNETIFLVIKPSLAKETLKSLNMKKFKGVIYLSFESDEKQVFKIIGEQTKAFFYNIYPSKVIIVGEKKKIFFQKEKANKLFIKVYKKEDLKEAISLLKSNVNIKVELKNSIVLEEQEYEEIKNLKLHWGQNVIYVKTDKHLAPPFRKIDKEIPIRKPEDWNKIKEIKEGCILLILKEDLNQFAMYGVSLENFTGTLIVEGNHHTIKNGVIETEKEDIGLFVQIHPYANVEFYNLKLDHMVYQPANYTGSLMGKRNKIPKNYYGSPLGYVIVKNCSISCSQFLGTSCYNPFIGYDENSQITNSDYQNIVCDNKYLKKGDNEIQVSKYENPFDSKMKGICITTGTDALKRKK